MTGTIYSGTYFSGIVLSNPATQLPATVAGGAYVTNTTTLHSGDAVYGVLGTAWTLDNLGTLTSGAGGNGIQLESGGYVANAGLITAASSGIVIANAAGTVVNSGTIADATALGIGVDLTAAGSTLTNAGTITSTSGTAVSFYGSNNRLILDPGNVLGGTSTVTGIGAVNNTLELAAGAATGTINSFFSNFGTLQEDAAASWVIPGPFAFFDGTIGVGASLVETGPLTFFTTLGNSGAIAASMTLTAGAYLDNRAGGTISSTTNAVYGTGGPVTVVNAGTIAGTGVFGSGIDLTAGGTVSNSGTIESFGFGAAAILVQTASGTVTNSGTILAAGGTGVDFTAAGSTLTNAGTITGTFGAAVFFYGSNNRLILDPGAVFGGTVSVTGTTTSGDTLELAAGTSTGTLSGFGTSFAGFGTLTVDSGASWQFAAANTIAAGILLTDSGALLNAGSIASTVTLTAGATLDNQAGGTISSATNAVYGIGGPATVVNAGTIVSTGATYSGIDLTAGGSITNLAGGLISGPGHAIDVGGTGTLVNSGTITGGYVSLGSGIVTNNAGALIATEVAITGTGTVTNAGTLAGGSRGVIIHGSGADSVTNSASNASISGYAAGVELYGSASAIVNLGTITATGTGGVAAQLNTGGTVTNGAIGATAALIAGNQGVDISGGNGVVLNFGTLSGTTMGFNFGAGIVFGAGGTVTNYGTVIGTGANNGGILVQYGNAVITNEAGAVIEGDHGVYVDSGVGTVTNIGTLVSTLYNTLRLADGGTATNSGTIESLGAGSAAILVQIASGTVTNSGTILAASGTGVDFTYSGSTLTNAGTITGAAGTAVSFYGSNNRLIFDPGAVFGGTVSVTGTTASGDTLELAAGSATGTLSGLGTQFTGFTTVAVDPAAVWQVSDAAAAPPAFTNDGTVVVGPAGLVFGAVSANSGQSGVIDIGGPGLAEFAGAVAASQTVAFTSAAAEAKLDLPSGFAGAIQNFQQGDTLDLAGVVANGYTYSGGVLTLTDNGATVAALTLATPYSSAVFTLAADGAGGTAIMSNGALSGSIVLSAAQERVALPAGTAVAHFSDGNTADIAGVFVATIAWGDGTTTSGTITGGAGAFTVSGSHSFADEGSFPLAVTVVRTTDNTTLALAGTVTAAESDSLSATSAGLSIVNGRTFSGVVASFADTDTTAPAGDFTATIAWGDGTTSVGTIAGGSGVLTVSGSHPYTTAGALPLSVTLADDPAGTAAATATGIAMVAPGNIFPGFYPNGILLNNPAIQSQPTITATGYVTNIPGSDSVHATAGFAWTLTNDGRVSGPGNGISLTAPGAVLNSSAVAGANGIVLMAGGSLANSGTVAGSGGAGVYMGNGGYILNGASGAGGALLTGRYGVEIGGYAGSGLLAVNLATIYGTSLGFAAGGTASDTLVNAGTVGGGSGTAIQFGGGGNLLVIDPHAVFSGRVDGGAGSNAIELAAGSGAGTLLGLGSKFHGFGTVTVDPGAVWHLADAPTAAPDFTNDGRIIVGNSHSLALGAVGEDPGMSGTIAVRTAGTLELTGGVDPQQTVRFADNTGTVILDDPQDFGATVQGFRAGDTIDVRTVAADGFTYANGTLTLTSGGNAAAALTMAGSFGASQFALAPDGQGGTDVTAAAGQLFAFTFVYADGEAYYSGTVADSGNLGYAAIANSSNPTISEPDGTYYLANDGPATTQPSGAVTVGSYSVSPPNANAAQTYVPLATGQGRFDGTAGLGSEADRISVNGTLFAFSPSLEFHPLLAS